MTPVIHVLQYPGCVPKPIPSFACIGRCASYLQVHDTVSIDSNLSLNATYLSLRFPAARYGRWNALACAAKSRGRGKPAFLYFVPNQNLERESSERLVESTFYMPRPKKRRRRRWRLLTFRFPFSRLVGSVYWMVQT